MSVFDKISVIKMPSATCEDWAFEMEGIRFDMHDTIMSIDSDIKDYNSFCSSLNNIFSLIENIDWNDGKFDRAVHELVDHNNELAQCLGIILPYSFASESDEVHAANDIKETVEDKSILEKAWAIIRKFFSMIWKKITQFFNFLANGFQSVIGPKIGRAQRNWGSMSQEERQRLLKETETNVSFVEFKDRATCSISIASHVEILSKFTAKDLLYGALDGRSPVQSPVKYEQIYPVTMLRLVESLGYTYCDFRGKTPDAINPKDGPGLPIFSYHKLNKAKTPVKTMEEQGYDMNSADIVFRLSGEVKNRIVRMKEVSSKFNSDIGELVLRDMVKQDTAGIHMSKTAKQQLFNSYKTAIGNIQALFKMYLYILNSYFVTDNKILDLFELSEEERKKKYPKENTK